MGAEIGSFMHPVESEMLCSLTKPTTIPYFNAPIYLENKTQIGKIDEILGPINEVYFTVKMEGGMVASSFKKEDKVYIGGDKLLPIERFLPKPKIAGAKVESESRNMMPWRSDGMLMRRRARWCQGRRTRR
jgi:H/ACA ribonucleoprotein complex subunit 1